jgi:outer membrane lipopolysaccharide assembly protein LptE/RlpB
MLSACGFHLSGYGKSTLPFESLSLETSQPYSNFTKALQKALENVGVHTTLATPASTRLQILAQNFARTTTSLGNAGQTSTYLLVYTLLFQLVDRTGNILLMPQQIRVTRSFSITSDQLDGDLNTENELQNKSCEACREWSFSAPKTLEEWIETALPGVKVGTVILNKTASGKNKPYKKMYLNQ